ncbi:response regulator [Sphingomonas sp. IW22]|uniref:response regulator n=1 Tax=Sphingomonas sp. IW22 TaxID=3242489 RepID=UPI00352277E4
MEHSRSRPLALIVEDDDAVRRSLHLLLRSIDYDVRAYATAARLLASQPLRAARVLLADYRLPDDDGIEVLRRLRTIGWRGRAFLLTGFATPELFERASDCGYEATLEKPIRPCELIRLLRY